MKDIELCGVGNALVDLQIEVTDEELKQSGLKKGSMILVDSLKQASMLEFLKFQTVNSVHLKNDDQKAHKRRINYCSGGSAANSIIAFTKFGGKGAYITSVGEDELGKYYIDEFKELGIVLDAQVINELPTGTCLVMISPDAERTMATSLGASSRLDKNTINYDLIKRSEWLYIEGYKLAEQGGFEFCKELIYYSKENNTKIAFTFSDSFITENFRSELDFITSNSHLVFCNETEALSWSQSDNIDDAMCIFNKYIDKFVITLGDKGSFIKWDFRLNGFDDNIAIIPANKVVPVDSTGAGDIFAGTFLFGLIKTNNPVIAAKMASYTSSLIVQQFGARLNADFDYIAKKFIFK